MQSLDSFRELLQNSKYVVAFTGAGISAESGIPTYRGSGGMWEKYDPEKLASIDYFHRDPSLYWNFFKDVRYPSLKQAQPNSAHYALGKLEEKGILKALITQNVDGLHQLAGNERVLEMHGNTKRILCLNCSSTYDMENIQSLLENQVPPKCPKCSGLLKPDVVLFGETLPVQVLDEANQEARKCDLFLSVGSSLVVQPAASLPGIAKNNGAKLVIINKGSTPFDKYADFVFHSSASEVLRDFCI